MDAGPKFRTDLIVTEYKDREDANTVVVKEPVSEKYYRLTSYEIQLLKELDGTVSIERAVERLKGRGHYYSIEDANGIVVKAAQYGLVVGTRFDTAEYLRARRETVNKAKRAALFSSVYFLFIPILNPDRFLERTLWIFRLLFNRFTLTIAALAAPGAIYLVLSGWTRVEGQYNFFFNWGNLLYLWITIALAKLIHEFAHAYIAKSFGLHVPQMGVAFLIFFPCLYCNTTDAWQLADRKQRMAIGAGGIIAEAMLAVAAAYVWHFTRSGIINSLAFYLMTVSLVSTILFNGNPLLKFDGYFILIDWLRIPNLAGKAAGYVKYLFMNRVFGISKYPDTSRTPREAAIFPIYGVSSFIYRIFLYTGIVAGVYYRFDKTLGLLLASMAFVLFVIRPILRGLRALHTQRGEIHPRFAGILVLVLLIVGVGTVLFTPISGHSVYPCYLASAKTQKLTVPLRTLVEEVLVKKGSVVGKGDILFTLDTSRLELELSDKMDEREIILKELELFRLDDEKRARVGSKEIELFQVEDDIRRIQEEYHMARGGIAAPFDGVITALDERMQAGFQPGAGVIVGELESTEDTVVYALIPELDLHKVRPGQDVKIWFPMGSGRLFLEKADSVRSYSERDLRDSPFSSRLGGELATEIKDEEQMDSPLEAQYQCTVNMDNDEETVPLGMTGRFVVPQPPRSIARRFVDGLVRTFNRESLL